MPATILTRKGILQSFGPTVVFNEVPANGLRLKTMFFNARAEGLGQLLTNDTAFQLGQLRTYLDGEQIDLWTLAQETTCPLTSTIVRPFGNGPTFDGVKRLTVKATNQNWELATIKRTVLYTTTGFFN